VKSQVIALLRAADLSTVRERDVLDVLGVSKTALISKLRDEGVTYTTLLLAERERRCRALLEVNPRADGYAMMRNCGYTEINSAYRAFKVWFGVPLREFRNNA